ncbi:tRNA pseudouridine38-40 synthase [Amphibacillus marinus]|uniref:tRNA pseudouridine synthase A n=1 Tax=Amphibacillus marinus TaxID=872970 RepID=A0A1H8SAV2_9BACI|nr:tRNA pseudouridine(38-40) synthase TruA [Amphibacillus marinus]SEO75408.1 tRNA pseudouridine38-40 synthase [Amphibacillus marinus]
MRYLATVKYDGTRYAGYQVQPNQMTIQSTIEAALQQLHKGAAVKITASGRTDAGVHANGQTFHFNSSLAIANSKWKLALNALLPDDIVIVEIKQVSEDFHARYDVIEKTYKYVIWNGADANPFERHYSYHIRRPLDLALIANGCHLLEGQHDFTAYCAANSQVKGSKVRTIYQAKCEQQGDYVVFTFTGSGFLYNMVRIMVGTLVEVGLAERKPETILTSFEHLKRSDLGKTAPAHGLYLEKVGYPGDKV